MQVLASAADAIRGHARESFKPADADRGGMWLRLLPMLLFDQFFFCSLPSSVLTPLSHEFSPHYSKDLKHEIGLPACGCQILLETT